MDIVTDQPRPIMAQLRCADSVLTANEVLVRLAATQLGGRPDSATVEFLLAEHAGPTIVLPTVTPAAMLDKSLGGMVALAENQVRLESLLMAVPEFDSSKEPAGSFAGATLVDYDGPKLGQQMQGADVSRLPKTDDH